MRLTRQSSYAIRTLVYCAVNDPQLSRVADIAKAHSISELFLFKLIKPLVENGLIQTVRGRHGGIRLGRPAAEITLLDTIQLTEENFAMAECFEDGDVTCPLSTPATSMRRCARRWGRSSACSRAIRSPISPASAAIFVGSWGSRLSTSLSWFRRY